MYDCDDILGYPLGNISPKNQVLVKAGKLIDMVGNADLRSLHTAQSSPRGTHYATWTTGQTKM